MNQQLHNTSIIHHGAKIGQNVKIGPFCVIGEHVILHDNVELKSHVVIEGYTEVGEGTVIYPFASIGFNSQDDRTPTGEITRVVIGKNNIIREYVTIQPGTTTAKREKLVTIVGDNNLLMLGTHIAHDCIIGNNVIFVNNATLGGHVEVGDFAQIGGLAAVHQYVRIGEHSIIGGVSAVVRDVIPFGMAVGDRACIEGINIVGMKRRGYSLDEVGEAKRAVELLFDTEEGVMTERIDSIRNELGHNRAVQTMLEFVEQDGSRAYCGPRK